jgi:hypothetical protein
MPYGIYTLIFWKWTSGGFDKIEIETCTTLSANIHEWSPNQNRFPKHPV